MHVIALLADLLFIIFLEIERLCDITGRTFTSPQNVFGTAVKIAWLNVCLNEKYNHCYACSLVLLASSVGYFKKNNISGLHTA